MDLKEMTQTKFDACVLGDSITADLMVHLLRIRGLSVIRINSKEGLSSERATLTHGWFWNLASDKAEWLKNAAGLSAEFLPFEMAIYDAKTHKRLKKFAEMKNQEWGDHEADYFNLFHDYTEESKLTNKLADQLNLNVIATLVANTKYDANVPFVVLNGAQIVELKNVDGKLASVTLAKLDKKKSQSVEITAENFFIANPEEYAEYFSEEDQKALIAAVKSKKFLSGFGVKFTHGTSMPSVPELPIVVPMVANPSKKEDISHVAGFFYNDAATEKQMSVWVGFLNSDELEDNNEILKKIKHTRRAIDRAVVGFADSVEKESVTFEMKLFAKDLMKNRKHEVFGAHILTDQFGFSTSADLLKSAMKNFEEISIKQTASAELPLAEELPVEEVRMESESWQEQQTLA